MQSVIAIPERGFFGRVVAGVVGNRVEKEIERELSWPEQTRQYGGLQAMYLVYGPRQETFEPIMPVIFLGGQMRVLLDGAGGVIQLTDFSGHLSTLDNATRIISERRPLMVMNDPLKGDFSPLLLQTSSLDRDCSLAQQAGSEEMRRWLDHMEPLSMPTPSEIYGVLG